MSFEISQQDQIKLARSLVNPDKAVRDSTFQIISDLLKGVANLSEMEMLKLWKALYYCMWLTDKSEIQTDTANTLCHLMDSCNSTKLWLLYIRAFFRTIMREWSLLDQHRLDKFYKLIRFILRKCLSHLYIKKFPAKLTISFLQVLREEVLTKTPNGVRYHMFDIFLPELYEVTKGDISTKKYTPFIIEFLTLLSETRDKACQQRLSLKIFEYYLNDFASENKNKQVPETDNSMNDGDGDDNSDEHSNSSTLFDSINTQVIQALLFQKASNPSTPDACRSLFYHLHKLYARITGVAFVSEDVLTQYGIPTTDVTDTTVTSSNTTSSKSKHNKNEKETSQNKLNKRKQENQIQDDEDDEEDGDDSEIDQKAVIKKKKVDTINTSGSVDKPTKVKVQISATEKNKVKNVTATTNASITNETTTTTVTTSKKSAQEVKNESLMKLMNKKELKDNLNQKKSIDTLNSAPNTLSDKPNDITSTPKATESSDNNPKKTAQQFKTNTSTKTKTKTDSSNHDTTNTSHSHSDESDNNHTAISSTHALYEYIASPKFTKPKHGYVFKKGKLGVGYYLDSKEMKKYKITPPSAVSKDSTSTSTPTPTPAKNIITKDNNKTSSPPPIKQQSNNDNKLKTPQTTTSSSGTSSSSSSSSSDHKQVSFGKSQSKDYISSVQGLLTSTPSKLLHNSSPVKPVLKKKNK